MAGSTRGRAVAILRDAFAGSGLDTPALDARLLGAAALGIEASAFLTAPDLPLTAPEADRLGAFGRRRIAREPVSRILGVAEFWGLPFRLSPETLVPRPDTETVVSAALARIADRLRPRRILDLGTGSGCLLVALLHEIPGAFGVGIDRADGAVRTARSNADANGIRPRAAFALSDWAAAVGGSFDLIVSNPPYIPSRDLAGLDPEVAGHDPAAALDGGPDGLAALRHVLADAARLLSPGGLALVEIGYDQGESGTALSCTAGLAVEAVERDLGGRPRVLVLRRR